MRDRPDRAAFIKSVVGKPYRLGGQGPDEFDCYGLTRYVQRNLFGRDMPLFQAPEHIGLQAIAGFLQVHPERRNWRPVSKPVDGAIVSMFKQNIGHHVGTWLREDGGVILHTVGGGEAGDKPDTSMGVVVDNVFRMKVPPKCWTAFKYYIPRD
ncbi:NlpC/P60 family protein [Microbaculum marinum]|uniref:NlpC/P60 family protein n=1 Tax=Microbaculum marinum TaxID=1764581 RepID=A0AAW9RSF8_9HYPH